MRQFKFRVWDERDQELVYIDDLYWFECNYIHNSGDAIIEQFTGMKDCNGVDIYENDLVDFYVLANYEDREKRESQKVIYDEELGMFVFGEDSWSMLDRIDRESIKVVGR